MRSTKDICLIVLRLGLVCVVTLAQVTPSPREIHGKLFKVKRLEHLDAVKTILNLGQLKKQKEMVTSLVKTINKVLSESKVSVERVGFVPGSEFPEERKSQELISTILENAAFFGDLALRLPDIIHPIYDKDKELKLLIPWAMHFALFSNLIDDVTEKGIHLGQQELGIIEKDAQYSNPYKTKTLRELNDEQHKILKLKQEQASTKSPKSKKKRGPSMSGRSDL